MATNASTLATATLAATTTPITSHTPTSPATSSSATLPPAILPSATIGLDGPHTNYSTFETSTNNRTSKRQRHGKGGTDLFPSNETDSTFTMQEALDTLGFGPYQIWMSCLFGIACMAEAMEVMVVAVLFPVLKCAFHLNAFDQAILTVVVFGGMALSGSFWGKVADKYGRKTMLFTSSLICSYFGILSAFSPIYIWVVINRFLVALGLGAYPQLVTFYSEFLPTKSRGTCILGLALVWGLGACLTVLLALATLPYHHWRVFLVLVALPIITFLCLFWFFPESPRILLAHGKYNEALTILKKIAKTNGKRLPEGRLYHPCEKGLDKHNISDIFIPKYRWSTFLITVGVVCVNMAYYGGVLLTTELFDTQDGCHGYTNQTSKTSQEDDSCRVSCRVLTHDDYLDIFYTTLGDMPGVVLCVILLTFMARKLSICLLMGLYTVIMASINFCAPRQVLVVLVFCTRALLNGAGQAEYFYITELYPTSVRAIAMGWCVTAKSIGTIVAALMAHGHLCNEADSHWIKILSQADTNGIVFDDVIYFYFEEVKILVAYSPFLAISSFAFLGFITTLTTALLPIETRNRKMTDTLAET